MDVLLTTILVAVLLLASLAVVIMWVRPFRRRRSDRTPWSSEAEVPEDDTTATVRLDVETSNADDPAVRRLVEQVAQRAFRRSPEVQDVTVVNRDGTVLAKVARPKPIHGTLPTAPGQPAGNRRPLELRVPQPGEQSPDGARFQPPPGRVWAERFDLPDSVRGRIEDPDRLVDVVAAVLAASGAPVEVHGDVIQSGDVAIIVIGEGWGGSSADELSSAFLRFERTGAQHGLVISAHYLDEREVRRRRALAPNLHYSGLHIIQWMADAVVAGGDPLQLAIALDSPST